MRSTLLILFTGALSLLSSCSENDRRTTLDSRTTLDIRDDKFYINGKITYAGRYWNDYKIEGLLMNSRMVQGIFDDLNPETRNMWMYPDSTLWDANRNTDEFVSNMATWKENGLLSFTINIQGGSPQGYSQGQPWYNSGFEKDGSLSQDYFLRLKKILDAADKLGMVPILGLFYFGQDERLEDETAVKNAVINTIDWLLEEGYRNILIEINNECNIDLYDHKILEPERIHELIEQAQSRQKDGFRYYCGTSYGGGAIPRENVVKVSDYLLLHGNGVNDPERIKSMVDETRSVAGYRPVPILFNEDDHFNFENPANNFVSAISKYASWGYFDYRMKGEGFAEGYQSVPVDWGINSERKRSFFKLLKEITGN